jgi:NADH pyrophosphatase NudC (nudix superfamily)
MLRNKSQELETPVQLDGELEDARWFELEQLRDADEALLPPPYTIARRLIETWIQERTGEQT